MKPIIFELNNRCFEFLLFAIDRDSDRPTEALIGLTADKEMVHLFFLWVIRWAMTPKQFWILAAAVLTFTVIKKLI